MMTTLFIADTEVLAGLAPFLAMRWNSAPAGAPLREKMSELVSKGTIDFFAPVLGQARIQRDEFVPEVRPAGAALQLCIPLHAKFIRQAGGTCSA